MLRRCFYRQAAITVREALNKALDEELQHDTNVVLLGEEVDQYNGAYKITKGLGAKYPRRVIDTPISELGFTGLAVGAAFKGLRPVVEYMSFNFALQAIDQIINGAAKAHYMSGGRLTCPIVFRGPDSVAAGVAAQHSQSLAPIFASIPGLKVCSVYSAEDARGMLKAAIRDDNPVVVLETELLYGTTFDVSSEALHPDFVIPFGKAKVERVGSDISIFAHGRGVAMAMEGAALLEKLGIDVEVVNLRSLRPIDRDAIVASVRKTHRAITVEEAFPYVTIGAEVVAIIAESEAFYFLDAPLERVACADLPMPYAKDLEAAAIPSPQDVVETVRRVVSKSLPAKV